ncbi:MAG TPA: cbb3-type cytochrome c oxidase subunit 3 [Pseudomonadales bacterium]|nr:cbb3-type cytochrome c oxidase subunit 3 [Pseudomonadales bacterium]
MDLNDLRGVMSAVILVTFIGLFVWTWMGRRDRFSEAADLPFADDPPPAAPCRVDEHETPLRREARQSRHQQAREPAREERHER